MCNVAITIIRGALWILNHLGHTRVVDFVFPVCSNLSTHIQLNTLKLTGKEHSVQKGVFFGLGVWLFLAGMLLSFGVSRYTPLNVSSKLMLLMDHAIFGATLGILVPQIALEQHGIKHYLQIKLKPAYKLIISRKDNNEK